MHWSSSDNHGGEKKEKKKKCKKINRKNIFTGQGKSEALGYRDSDWVPAISTARALIRTAGFYRGEKEAD